MYFVPTFAFGKPLAFNVPSNGTYPIAILVFFIKRCGADDNEPYPFILKVYLILSLQYFVFGFGPYSNRYAVMAWFFLPILLSAVVSKLNFKKQDLIFIAPILFLVSVCYFVFVRLDWASFV